MGSLTIRSAASLAFLTGTAFAQGTLFPVNYWYPAGDAPYGSALADLNADGALDCLVADYFTDKVSVYLGAGNGLLNPLPPVVVGGQPRALAVADMNGDTRPDCVTVDTNDLLSVLLGDGLGGFGAPTLFSTPFGSSPVWIDAGDLDGDGDVDIVTGDQGTAGTLTVLLGDGTGALAAPVSEFVGFRSERIRLADVNGDGHLDCVSASWLDDRVAVSLGDGNGNLIASFDAYAPSPKGLAVGDVNADGRADVLVASSDLDIVRLFLANANGSLQAPKTFWLHASNLYPTSVMLADVSGDGRADFITCNAGQSKSLTVFVAVGGGDFGFALTSPIPESAFDAVAGDLNGDGLSDIVSSNQTDDSIRVHIAEGVGSWEHYCTAKTNSLGCVPKIYGIGTPSVSNPRPFRVFVENVLNSKPGLFLYTVNGTHAATPFHGGTLCLGSAAIRRTPAHDSGINPKVPAPNCTGSYALDVNAFAQGLAGGNPHPGLLVLGNTYQLQAWSRDPGFAAPNNSGLSAALFVTPWL